MVSRKEWPRVTDAQKLSISSHISSLFLLKLTTDYQSSSHRLSKYEVYFVAGSRQESNFKIWILDHQIHQASIFMPAELT